MPQQPSATEQSATPTTQPAPSLIPPDGRSLWLWEEDPPKDFIELYQQIAVETLHLEVPDFMQGLGDGLRGDIYGWIDIAVVAALAAANVESSWQPRLEAAIEEVKKQFPI